MLSRSGQGLYWMGRYLERAEQLCRLLRVQVETLVDRPSHDIYLGWNRIYGGLGRMPPSGALQLGSEDLILADSYALAEDLTFERTNPDSVWSCFNLGRENARQMRHCISEEMWSRLNLAYLHLQRQSMVNIWQVSPESFYAETVAEMDTFVGVADSTMYRDDGWHFMELGRAMERAQFFVSLLLSQIRLEATDDGDAAAGWTGLLRACHALEAYLRSHSSEVAGDRALDFLVTDPGLPASVSRSLDSAGAALAALGAGPSEQLHQAAQRLSGRLGSLVHYEWPDRTDREGLLRQVGSLCRDLHDLITAAYFDYPVESAPIH